SFRHRDAAMSFPRRRESRVNSLGEDTSLTCHSREACPIFVILRSIRPNESGGVAGRKITPTRPQDPSLHSG
ncbi:MAG: hypothetical protein PHY28_04715, partial [Dehalococcoidales bacterium]|nr:hypothetical protein [Dehalococcoidales bacterium]